MNLDPVEREKLEGYRLMMGNEAGNLALALDRLTDSMALIGQHTVYCRIAKGPHAAGEMLDLTEVMASLETVKRLVQETMMKIR